jgi:Uma2 family endonuclease
MSRDSQRHYSVDDYFMVEEMSEVKHEYCNGGIFAMAGASVAHNEIAANVVSELRFNLRDTDCGAYGSDLRVQTPSGLYTYPDVSVICGEAQLIAGRSDTATNPRILVEVLSEATEEYDRGDKFALCKSIPTLQHYIVISQTEILVDHFERMQSGDWKCHSYRDRHDIIRIPTPTLTLSLSEVFRRVF